MIPILEIARLTILEIVRKRTFLAAVLLSLLALAAIFTVTLIAEHAGNRGVAAAAAEQAPPGSDPDNAQRGPVRDGRHGRPVGRSMGVQALRAGGVWIVRTFPTILAILLAAGAISTERESGTLHTIVSKPIRRSSVVLGKWLGINAALFVYLLVLGVVLTILIATRAGYVPWPVVRAAVASLLFPAVFASLGLLLSTFASVWVSVALGLFAWGVGAQEYGVLRAIAHGLSQMKMTAAATSIEAVCTLAGLLVPLGRIGGWVDRAGGEVLFMIPSPVPRPDATMWSLVYVLAYVAVILGLGTFVFQRRDM